MTGKKLYVSFFFLAYFCYEIRQLIATLFLPIIAVPVLKFVLLSKANVVLLILLRNCGKRSFVSLWVAEHGAIFLKPRAETLVTFCSHVHRTVTIFTYSFVINNGYVMSLSFGQSHSQTERRYSERD